MRIFQQRTRIQKYDGVKAFVKEYQIGENDFILASKSVYEKFFMPLELKAHVEYKGKYGAVIDMAKRIYWQANKR